MRSLPTDAVQTAALLGDLPDVDGHDLFAEKLPRGSLSLGILLNAKHRQENHPFRLHIVQVAADGADPTGRDKGKSTASRPQSCTARFTCCSKPQDDSGRLHSTVRSSRNRAMPSAWPVMSLFREGMVKTSVSSSSESSCTSAADGYSGFRKDAVADQDARPGRREHHVSAIKVDIAVCNRQTELRSKILTKIGPQIRIVFR